MEYTDIMSVVSNTVSSYLSSLFTMAGFVFFVLGLTRFKTFSNNKKHKNVFIAGAVLLGLSVVLPVLAGLIVVICGFLFFHTDSLNGQALDVFLNSAFLSTGMSIVSWLLKLAGCTMLVSVFALNYRTPDHAPEEPAWNPEQQMPPQEDAYYDPSYSQAAEEPYSDPSFSQQTADTAQASYETASQPEKIHMQLSIFVLLWMFTFGIGVMIWVHRVTTYLNRVPGTKPTDALAQCLLCGFVPFYQIYWFYTHGKKLEQLLQSFGKNENLSTLLTILGVCCPLAGGIIMQDHLNKLPQ